MASIWICEPKRPQPRKLQGHISAADVKGRFAKTVAKVAKLNSLKVVEQHELEAVLRFPNGGLISLYIEPYSPPSAPEEGQPKRVDGGKPAKLPAGEVPKGVLLRGGKQHPIGAGAAL